MGGLVVGGSVVGGLVVGRRVVGGVERILISQSSLMKLQEICDGKIVGAVEGCVVGGLVVGGCVVGGFVEDCVVETLVEGVIVEGEGLVISHGSETLQFFPSSLPRCIGICVGLGGTMKEGVPLWSNASEVIEPSSPCQAKEVRC